MSIWEKRVGEKYRKLTFVKYLGKDKAQFLCDCGELCEKRYYDVRRGSVTSCGCNKEGQFLPNLEGERYGKLIAVKELEIRNGQRFYLFRCECGNVIEHMIKEARRGKLKSCGCGQFTQAGIANTTHGMSNTRIHGIWNKMKARCLNTRNKSYKYYGGRGISICDEWLSEDKGFVNFYEWSMKNGYTDELSIDRIDNDGNYEPSNCRWTTAKVQNNNTRANKIFVYKGEPLTLAQWDDRYDLTYDSLWKRVHKYGYSIEKALTYKTHRISKKED